VVIGDAIEGNSIWYHADNNCYYWSGGIDNVEFELPGKDLSKLTPQDAIAVIVNLKNAIFDRYYNKHFIIGIGAGVKNDKIDNDLCITFFVSQKDSAGGIIPDYFVFKGYRIPTDVKSSGIPGSHQYDPNVKYKWVLADKGNIAHCGGGLVDSSGNMCGTRTIYMSKDKKNYLLTCLHVVALSKIVDTGDHFCPDLSDTIFHFTRAGSPCFKVNRGSINTLWDYALIDIGAHDMDNLFPHPYLISTKISKYYLKEELKAGIIVYSFGATSGPQIGSITDPMVDIQMMVNQQNRSYKGLIRTTKISEPGDSGAPVVAVDGRLIGYAVGGLVENTPTENACTYLIPWYYLNDHLGFKIV